MKKLRFEIDKDEVLIGVPPSFQYKDLFEIRIYSITGALMCHIEEYSYEKVCKKLNNFQHIDKTIKNLIKSTLVRYMHIRRFSIQSDEIEMEIQ